ncbi:hypothetical protein BDD12DRAFT_939628, partial [Trichophaea hybrida]
QERLSTLKQEALRVERKLKQSRETLETIIGLGNMADSQPQQFDVPKFKAGDLVLGVADGGTEYVENAMKMRMHDHGALQIHFIIRDLFSFSLNMFRKLNHIVKKSTSEEHRMQWDEERGRLMLWGREFSVLEGELDVTFIRYSDKHLRESTIILLCNIAKALASDRTDYESTCDVQESSGQGELADLLKEVADEMADDLGLDLDLHPVHAQFLDDPVEESITDAIEDIRSSIDCLYNLVPSINEKFISEDMSGKDSLLSEAKRLKSLQPAESSFPAQYYALNICDKFPKIETSLAQAMGEINWTRHQRVRQWIANQEQLLNESACKITAREQDSGIGDSIFTFEAPMHPTRRNPFADDKSEVSATSFGTTCSSVSGNANVPRPPVALAPGVKFKCTICFQQLSGVNNRLLWKKHVLRDLQPYSCLFTSCPEWGKTFSSRRLWVAHEFSNHRSQSASKWRCNQNCNKLFNQQSELRDHLLHDHIEAAEADIDDNILQCEEKKTICCPFCAEDIPETKFSIQQHIGTHMDEIALKSLPQHYESESNSSVVSTPSIKATEASVLSFHDARSVRGSTNSLRRRPNPQDSREQTNEITMEVNVNEKPGVLSKSDPDLKRTPLN